MNNDYVFTKKFKRLVYQGELSQSELSKRLGVSQQAVSMWINGKKFPRTSTVMKIAEIYGVDFSYFFKDEEESNVSSVLDTNGNTIDSALDVAKRFSKLSEEQKELVLSLLKQMGV